MYVSAFFSRDGHWLKTEPCPVLPRSQLVVMDASIPMPTLGLFTRSDMDNGGFLEFATLSCRAFHLNSREMGIGTLSNSLPMAAGCLLCHFDQFGRPCYALHTCRNFGFGTLAKPPLHCTKNSADDRRRPEILGLRRGTRQSIRHLPKMTVTSVTFRRFERPRYALLPN